MVERQARGHAPSQEGALVVDEAHATELDEIIRRVNGREPMSTEELRRAADVLRPLGRSTRAGLTEARARVALQLERMERLTDR